jgi:3-oxoacyl-[acyl-carrier protein] reductase
LEDDRLAIPAATLFDLTGEVALVTGASSGLGRRFAEVLAASGAKVAVAARRKDRLDALVASIKDAGGEAMAIEADVSDRPGVVAMMDRAQAAFGAVTVMVNNAGVPGDGRSLTLSEDQWREVMNVNLDAVWHGCQEAARRMAEAKTPGAIVNIASILGFRAQSGLAAYAASKAAVIQLTRSLALEWARHNIRVNAIAPGYILTAINDAWFKTPEGAAMAKAIPQRRIGDPSDLDGAILLLASRRASGFMTGATVVVDGGHSAALPVSG